MRIEVETQCQSNVFAAPSKARAELETEGDEAQFITPNNVSDFVASLSKAVKDQMLTYFEEDEDDPS